MPYLSIQRTVHMTRSTELPQVVADREYEARLRGWGTFRSGVRLGGHEVFVVNFSELALLTDRIREQEAQVEALWRALPSVANQSYLVDLLSNELESTNTIEGVRSTRKEIGDALESAMSNDGAHRRFGEMAKLFMALSADDDGARSLPETLEDVRAIYDRVVSGELAEADRPDGDLFRAGPVYIDDPSTGRRIHAGVVPESEIKVALTQWLALMRNQEIPPLLRAVMCHFVFEYVHPFYDGNGRTGRFLLALQLRQALGVPTAVSISPAIEAGKDRYYKAFEEAQHPLNCCDASLFCRQMLRFVSDAQQHLVDDLTEKSARLGAASEALRRLCSERGYDETLMDILGFLTQKELFGVGVRRLTRGQMEQAGHMGRARVRNALARLESDGMVAHAGQRPARYFLAEEARRILLG